MFWSSYMSLSLRLQSSSGSDFLRQFVSGNWNFQLQLSASWELLGEKRERSSFSKCWWIQHNEHVTDHKDRLIRFLFLSNTVVLHRREGGSKTVLANSIDMMLKRLSAAHCYSLTAPVGIATGCISLFFSDKNLWNVSVHSQQTVSSKQAAKHSVL